MTQRKQSQQQPQQSQQQQGQGGTGSQSGKGSASSGSRSSDPQGGRSSAKQDKVGRETRQDDRNSYSGGRTGNT